MRRRRAKKEGEQSLGRSRGGFSTKIHLATDALGNALRFLLTGGERNDITQAAALVKDLCAEHVIADKGYDAEAFVLYLQGREAEAVIPSRATNKVQREIDTHLYKERHLRWEMWQHLLGNLPPFQPKNDPPRLGEHQGYVGDPRV